MATKTAAKTGLPLRSRTPDRWAEAVLREPLALLNDHMHLEKKAAANALLLLNRWPEGGDADGWTGALAAVARDEAAHLQTVSRVLRRRGGKPERGHRNPYATALHGLVRKGDGPRELADLLMVAALIEARSCERFEALGRISRDAELAQLYRSLRSSEAGHHAVFLRLARQAAPAAAELERRWDWMLDREAEILAAQPAGPRMHSGVPGSP